MSILKFLRRIVFFIWHVVISHRFKGSRTRRFLPAVWVFSHSVVVLMDSPANAEWNSMEFRESTFSANLKAAPLESVLKEIEDEKGIWFKLSEPLRGEQISVQFSGLLIEEGLKRILSTTNFCLIFDRQGKLRGAFVFWKAGKGAEDARRVNFNKDIIKVAQHGDTAALNDLLDKGADVNAKGKYSGWTPLMLAARGGHTDKIKVLLAQGADINLKSKVRRRTALMEAIRHRKLDAVEDLLAGDPDVDAEDWEGYTGLMFAAISGQIEIVKALLRQGADVNVKNKFGVSALKMAADYPDIVRLLKEVRETR